MAISTRPYLLKAIYQWCLDNGFTPHIVVDVDAYCQVPMQYVVDGQITLNISITAAPDCVISDHLVEFSARFGGKPFNVMAPIGRVVAVYARENGDGIGLGAAVDGEPEWHGSSSEGIVTEPVGEVSPSEAPKRSHLQVVK